MPDTYSFALPITKSDTVNFPVGVNAGLCDAIYVGTSGVVTAVLENNSQVAFTCISGQILPIRAKRVMNSGTSALLVALYR